MTILILHPQVVAYLRVLGYELTEGVDYVESKPMPPYKPTNLGGKTVKIEIYEEKPKVEEEKVLRLKLEMDGSGGAILTAVDEDGEVVDNGYLLEIQYDGALYLYPGVSRDLGLRLDLNNRLEVRRH